MRLDLAELLESQHAFPGSYCIKAIGSAADDFVERVLEAARTELAVPSDLDYSERWTNDRRHVSVTLDLAVQSSDQVLRIYARLREVAGIKLVM
ncbi:protein of unknown function DUF493 [Isosphaera pallida ATCC 43644]|jgi:putative lipoic acid-binding regulatory protein|uniref:Uncharacterized protein n=1 Tax=Isosphaera pallida (strain ATCC 43644 / DSM 9630 / IS1B) TaxID=575540 RepID=E8R6S4_ISOPI|nr:DUF493 domain-containing protein [Isosphaera pallida]ADV63976.1 protein of unknown function DUF493 [Isosphaera pallida ATCC 43644]